MNTKEAAEYLGEKTSGRPWTVGHLANLRYLEAGPAYTKIRGRVRYEQSALDAWLESEAVHFAA